jgi:adenylate kinase
VNQQHTSGHTSTKTRLLIMGPPGAGKGTQAALLAGRLRIPAVSTGDMFRALQHADTPLAVQVRAVMAAGGYVDDATTNDIVTDRLGATDCADGFLLDGYPRTLSQVLYLDELLAQAARRLDAVICLRVDEEEVVQRLVARGQMSGRVDDTPQTIRARLAVYQEQTAPLLETYRARGLLLPVDAMGTVQDVAERIALELDGHAALDLSILPTP